MLSMTKESVLKPEDVIRRAMDFFGSKGLGLTLREEESYSVYFEGGGGGVRVNAAESKKGSTIDVETREWESQVEDFLARIK